VHFLKPGSAVDTEARNRTTSIYLVNRVIPMLPHGLCNHLCSLNPNQSKLSFSVFFRLERDTGELVADPPPRFVKTAIRSCCRLNYDEVQEVLDGHPIDVPPVYGGYSWDEIEADLHLLHEVCGHVRWDRLENGALTLSRQRLIFHTRESEDGLPTGYHLESHSASHWIIEELMLLANKVVARHLAASPLQAVSVLRNHERPDPEKANALARVLKDRLGLHWSNWMSAGGIYKSCKAIRGKFGEMLGRCIESMVMRSGMKQARYFLYGSGESPHHFALNFDHYTHFTSPIRRYPDVMVHRVLEALIAGQDTQELLNIDEERESELVDACNDKKRATRRCTEALDRAVFCIFLRSMNTWFYTIGTVLNLSEGKNGGDAVTVYCSTLDKESKIMLCKSIEELQLLQPTARGGEDDYVLPPETWHFRGKGCLDLKWRSPDGSQTKNQRIRMLSCLPVVIIPTDEVPISYVVFFVSPFHPRHEGARGGVSTEAEEGFEWNEEVEEGVEVVYNVRQAE